LKEGSLVQIIDQHGERQGLAIFVKLVEPFASSSNLWTYEVLKDGDLVLIETGYHTLIPADEQNN